MPVFEHLNPSKDKEVTNLYTKEGSSSAVTLNQELSNESAVDVPERAFGTISIGSPSGLLPLQLQLLLLLLSLSRQSIQ